MFFVYRHLQGFIMSKRAHNDELDYAGLSLDKEPFCWNLMVELYSHTTNQTKWSQISWSLSKYVIIPNKIWTVFEKEPVFYVDR